VIHGGGGQENIVGAMVADDRCNHCAHSCPYCTDDCADDHLSDCSCLY